jgi:F-type H+-transporting ATPase subunit b
VEELGINPVYLIGQIVNFLLVAGLLGVILYKPVMRAMEDRQSKIRQGQEDARQAAQARDNAQIDAQRIIDEHKQQAGEILEEARNRAAEIVRNARQRAEEEGREIRERMQREARAEYEHMLEGVRDDVADMVILATRKVIGDLFGEAEQRALIEEFFASLPDEVDRLRGMVDKGVRVTSALPLDDDEKAKVKRALEIGEADFTVDPAILGGLVIRVGDQVVNGSARYQLDRMGQSLH